MQSSHIRNSRWRWVACVGFGAFVLASAFYFDAATQEWIVRHPNAALKTAMRGVSKFGDWPGHILLALIGLGVAYGRGKKRWMSIFAAMIIACALAGIVTRVVKIAAGRARPSVKIDAVERGARFTSKYNSFPSGHTAASTAFFCLLFLARRRWAAALLVIPVVIAFSRMYIAAHYLFDVVGAVIIGVLCAVAVARWMQLSPPFIDSRRS